MKELEEIAPIFAKLDKINFYQVEEGYFADSQVKIIDSVIKPGEQAEALLSILSSIPKKELYSAPALSYFESFSGNLINNIHAKEVMEELAHTLPILQHVEKKQPYRVPATYFASFPDSVTKLAKKESIEHTSSLEKWSSRWSDFTETVLALISRPGYSFAMASVVSMIVLISLVISTKTTLSGDDKIFAQMQQIPDADLHHYIAKHRDEFDERTILNNINNVEFTHYFDKPDQVTPHIESHTKGVTDDDITNDDILD